MKKWKYIIFDMDGTLFDSEVMSIKAWMHVKEVFGYPITEDFCIQLIGRTPQSAQPIYQKYMPEDFNEEAVYKEHRRFMIDYKKKHGPLPKCDLHTLLTTLKNKGYKLGLCTSSKKEVVDDNLSHEQIEDLFDAISHRALCERGKPYPDLYLKAAELLQADPKECLVIEDSKSGILSAHNAGMDVIMVVDLVQPDTEMKDICYKIYPHLEDILNIL